MFLHVPNKRVLDGVEVLQGDYFACAVDPRYSNVLVGLRIKNFTAYRSTGGITAGNHRLVKSDVPDRLFVLHLYGDFGNNNQAFPRYETRWTNGRAHQIPIFYGLFELAGFPLHLSGPYWNAKEEIEHLITKRHLTGGTLAQLNSWHSARREIEAEQEELINNESLLFTGSVYRDSFASKLRLRGK